MDKLKAYIEAGEHRTRAEWAAVLGISRPYLSDLLDGARNPSIEVAVQIEEATDGAVRVRDWPNHGAVIDAHERLTAHTPPATACQPVPASEPSLSDRDTAAGGASASSAGFSGEGE